MVPFVQLTAWCPSCDHMWLLLLVNVQRPLRQIDKCLMRLHSCNPDKQDRRLCCNLRTCPQMLQALGCQLGSRRSLWCICSSPFVSLSTGWQKCGRQSKQDRQSCCPQVRSMSHLHLDLSCLPRLDAVETSGPCHCSCLFTPAEVQRQVLHTKNRGVQRHRF